MNATLTSECRAQMRERGFTVVKRLIDHAASNLLIDFLASLPSDDAARTRSRQPYARRNLLELLPIQTFALSEPMLSAAHAILGQIAKPVRGILFDKTPSANWLVPWHQDLSIAVKKRIDVPGFGPWSEKAGVVHVQPPVEVLRQMVTIRLHLDDCTTDNGPLRVVPATHERALTPSEIAQRSGEGPQVACVAPAGGAVIMRPLILHASSPAKSPSHRRVIHIEYAACDLPDGLEWRAAS